MNSERKESKFNQEVPQPGTEVRTACGGSVRYTPSTPSGLYQDETIYFCLDVCKEDYERDPRFSCLAGRIMTDSLKK